MNKTEIGARARSHRDIILMMLSDYILFWSKDSKTKTNHSAGAVGSLAFWTFLSLTFLAVSVL